VHHLAAAWKNAPNLSTQTAAQEVAAEQSRITGSEDAREEVTAAYLQLEATFLSNRLHFLTGVRPERTNVSGHGPLFDPNAVCQRDANGNFLRNAAGVRIRKPAAGANNSMEQLFLIRKERAAKGAAIYDGGYPSIHATFDLRENLLLRGAYAKTYGRPDFPNIVPNLTINESDLRAEQQADPDALLGTITVNNPGLRPWSADNYDLSLEHYSQSGGVLSAGLFCKEIKDFFGDDVRLATAADLEALGLDPQDVGWRVSTQFNSGDARVSGVEFNLRQPLRGFGE